MNIFWYTYIHAAVTLGVFQFGFVGLCLIVAGCRWVAGHGDRTTARRRAKERERSRLWRAANGM